MFYGRRQRSSLPILPSALAPIDHQIAHNARKRTNDLRKVHFDKTAQPLQPLELGQRVRVQDPKTKRWEHEGVVAHKFNDRRYAVKFEGGRGEWIRNRRFLRPQNWRIELDKRPINSAKEKPMIISHCLLFLQNWNNCLEGSCNVMWIEKLILRTTTMTLSILASPSRNNNHALLWYPTWELPLELKWRPELVLSK